ncbi:GntR family transcriptional regulator [Frondihabitans cladoniiphilus]|uniref:GntR family transcriptional regulator n=1 Tax=Frondihabitans cladoniiphilus TaxID=715785 RepID=UPI0031E9C8F7
MPESGRAKAGRELLSDGVRRRILTAILDGTLAAGERLHDEELIVWLGVSRTPIRTALERLSEVGLVEMEPNRFTRVALPTHACLADALAVYATLTATAARTRAPERTESDLLELSRRVARLTRPASTTASPQAHGSGPNADSSGPNAGGWWGDDDLRAIDSVVGFFAERSGNPILVSVLREVEMRLVFFLRALPVPVEAGAVASFATALLDAASDRDGESAAREITEFLTRRIVVVGGPA